MNNNQDNFNDNPQMKILNNSDMLLLKNKVIEDDKYML